MGGAEVLLRNTINGMSQFEHFLCYLRKPAPLLSSIQIQDTYYIGHRSWSNVYSSIRQLTKIIDKHRPDIIHSHLFEPTLLARISCPKKIKFFFTIHNILSKDAFEVNRLSLMAEKLTYKKRHHLIAVSGQALNDYDKWVGIKGPADVLYNYVGEKFFDLQYNYNQPVEDSFKLVAVGNLRRQKNYSALLAAFEMLKDLPVSLDIYGDGDMKDELQTWIDTNKLNVRLMGRVDDVSKILLNYHAYILPSLFEGFGIAPMEAMAAGMPVLLSDLEVFREIGEDVPIYFDPASPTSIALAIRSTFSNWKSISEKARSGKALIANKASREVYFKKLIEIYSK